MGWPSGLILALVLECVTHHLHTHKYTYSPGKLVHVSCPFIHRLTLKSWGRALKIQCIPVSYLKTRKEPIFKTTSLCNTLNVDHQFSSGNDLSEVTLERAVSPWCRGNGSFRNSFFTCGTAPAPSVSRGAEVV